MSALVSLDAAKRFLGVPDAGDDVLLQSLLDQIEALLATQCGREDAPFAVAPGARTETHDGTGTATLFLDYPIVSLSSVTLGPDPDAPDDTLDPDDPRVLRWQAGRWRVLRLDGGTWGTYGQPAHVTVTYEAGADLPADCALAVQRVVAQVYRQLGSEDATRERSGSYDADLATVAAGEPLWRAAVNAHCRRRF